MSNFKALAVKNINAKDDKPEVNFKNLWAGQTLPSTGESKTRVLIFRGAQLQVDKDNIKKALNAQNIDAKFFLTEANFCLHYKCYKLISDTQHIHLTKGDTLQNASTALTCFIFLFSGQQFAAWAWLYLRLHNSEHILFVINGYRS